MRETPFDYKTTGEGLNIKEEFYKYLSYWPSFVTTMAVFFFVAFLYLRYAAVTYETSAKIKILDETAKGLELPNDLISFLGTSKVNLENEMEILKSYRLLERVVKDLELTTRYYEVGKLTNKELWNPPFKITILKERDDRAPFLSYDIEVTETGFSIYDANGNSWNTNGFDDSALLGTLPFLIKPVDSVDIKTVVGMTFTVNIQSMYQTVMGLSRGLTIASVGKKSEILSLSIKGSNRNRSEAIINNTIKQFNEDGIADRQLVSQRTLDFVDERFVYLESELDSIEVDKKEYKRKNGLSYIAADANYTIAKKSEAEEETVVIETQVALAELLKQTLVNDAPYELLPANIGVENHGINSQIGSHNNVVLQRETILTSAGENHPKVRVLTAQIDELQKNILISVEAYKEQLATSLSKIKAVKQRSQGLFSSIPRKEKILRSIERQQNIKESLYVLLLQKREEAAINLAITAPSVKIVDHAITDIFPVSPKKNSVYLSAIALGFVLPFIILYVTFLLDSKIRDKNDVTDVAPQIPVVGEIPFIKGDKLVMTVNDRSILAESFRILRTNVNFVLPQIDSDDAKVIYVTSTIKGEGKTFTALNLALANAIMKKRVLLIGSDFRNPQLHSYTNLTKEHLGLSNYLINKELDWHSIIEHNVFNTIDLKILFSGTIPPMPAELLSNKRFEKLLEEAKQEFDYIIVDTAPTILVTDTLLISKHADATVYVTRAGYTERRLLEFSKELNDHGKLVNMAYVVNNIEAEKTYGYGYSYNYGYGYGYDASGNKKPWYEKALKFVRQRG